MLLRLWPGVVCDPSQENSAAHGGGAIYNGALAPSLPFAAPQTRALLNQKQQLTPVANLVPGHRTAIVVYFVRSLYLMAHGRRIWRTGEGANSLATLTVYGQSRFQGNTAVESGGAIRVESRT
eukprot:2359112-Rhodomonas_salina.1